MSAAFTIVGLGEALFDIFPDRQVLGGATLNAAIHAHALASGLPRPGRGVVVSRVGQDEAGGRLLADLGQRGMTCDFVQTDPDHDTGKVYVGRDAAGATQFDIVADVAWDKLQYDPDMEQLAQRCEAVCFGTLAQRDGQARYTIHRFLDAAARAVRLCDVNLRPPFYDARILRRSLELANAVKLNEPELAVVTRLLGLAGESGGAGASGGEAAEQQVRALLGTYRHLKLLALTRGPRGTVLYTPSAGAGTSGGAPGRYEQPPVSYPAAPGADAVGAGDACCAGLLVGLLLRWPLERTLTLANHAGAFVASQPGGTPALPKSILDMVRG
jgi:fructokinase